MPFKTELHAHTSEVSPCADLTASEVAERYIAAGYTTVMVTNHYSNASFIDDTSDTWEQEINHYLSGYLLMKEAAKGRLNVLLGCELRFQENGNDYLILGLDEDFLIKHPHLHKMSLADFSSLARKNNLLIVQAHPFRNGMLRAPVEYLDGVEVFNAHTGHNSRNQLANEWALSNALIRTSGSDFHHSHSVEAGGIITDDPITSQAQLIAVLKSKQYWLICEGPAAERDGMKTFLATNKF